MSNSPPVLGPFLAHCIRCRRPIKCSGGSESIDFMKMVHAKDGVQSLAPDGMGNSYLHDSCRKLGFSKQLPTHFKTKNGGNTSFMHEFSSISEEVKNYMRDMETQIRLIRGENYELKSEISHLYTLVKVTNYELRSRSNKINEKVESLAKVLDKGCLCSTILNTKITYVQCCVKIIEAKIDSMRTKIRKSTQDLQNDVGGLAGGPAGQAIASLQ